MKSQYLIWCAFALLSFISLSACGNRNSVITMPEEPFNTTVSQAYLDSSNGQVAALGMFDVVLNTEPLNLSMNPLRKASEIGDSWNMDIAQYLQNSPCTDCLSISNIGLSEDENVFIDVGIKHPYPESVNRLDLDVFDVRLIVIVEGSEEFPQTIYADRPLVGNFSFVANADGYTTHYDDGKDGPYPGSINAFINYFTEDDPTWDGVGEKIENHRMPMGADYDHKRILFNIPNGGTYNFRLCVEACYGHSAKKGITDDKPGSRQNPLYYVPEFNRKEPYSLVARVEEIEYGANPQCVVVLEVADWQAEAIVDCNLDDLTDIIAPSCIDTAALEIPSMSYREIQNEPCEGIGTSGDPWRLRFTVPMSAMSVYPFMASVRDERHALVEDLDMSIYQYGKINSFIQTSKNKIIANTGSSEPMSFLGSKSIAVDGDCIYIVYADLVDLAGRVFCVRSIDGGETFNPPVMVSDEHRLEQKLRPSVAVDDAHIVYVVWEDFENLNPFSDAQDIKMAISVNNGFSFGQDIRVNDEESVADDSQMWPMVAAKDTGQIFVTWTEKPSGTNLRHVRLARSINGGATFLAETIVSLPQKRTGNSALAINHNDVIWVVWRDFRYDHQDIFAARSMNNGQSFSVAAKVNQDTDYQYQSSPQVAVDDAGIAYIVWEDSREPGLNDFNIYFSYSQGESIFSTNKKINRKKYGSFQPNIAITPDGGVFVAYMDSRDDCLGDIYVTGSFDGGRTFSIDHDVRVNDDRGIFTQALPQIAVGKNGKLFMAWEDKRDGISSIAFAKSIFP